MTSDNQSHTIAWNQKVFDLIAGFSVFVAVTLIIADVEPGLAYAILAAAFGYMVLSHADAVGGFIGNFRSAMGKA